MPGGMNGLELASEKVSGDSSVQSTRGAAESSQLPQQDLVSSRANFRSGAGRDLVCDDNQNGGGFVEDGHGIDSKAPRPLFGEGLSSNVRPRLRRNSRSARIVGSQYH